MKVSVVLPVYNAKRFLAETVERLDRVLHRLSVDYEILLRDDGSIDGSRQILSEVIKRFPKRVKYTVNAYSQGLGFTLRKLFEDASGDVIVYLDCDLPFGENIIADFLREIKNVDVVVASRYVNKMDLNCSFIQNIANRMYWGLCKVLFNISVKDIGSGSIAMRRNVLSNLKLASLHYEIQAEIFIKAKRQGFRIKEISAESRKEEKKTFEIIKRGIPTVLSTLKMRFQLIGIK